MQGAHERQRREGNRVGNEAGHEHVEEPEGHGREQREVPQAATLDRCRTAHAAPPEHDEAEPPSEIQEKRIPRRPWLDLRADVDRRRAEEELDVLDVPDAEVGREVRVEEEGERDAEHGKEDESPLRPALDPELVDEEEHAEAEERLERGVAERVEHGDDPQGLQPVHARQRDRDEDQQERQELRPEPHHPEREVRRAGEHEERHRKTPRPDRPQARTRQQRGDERAEAREGHEPARGRIAEPRERDQHHVEEELLVAEPLVHDAEPRPVEGVEDAPLRVRSGDGEVVVAVGVVEHRQARVDEVEERRRHEEDERHQRAARREGQGRSCHEGQ